MNDRERPNGGLGLEDSGSAALDDEFTGQREALLESYSVGLLPILGCTAEEAAALDAYYGILSLPKNPIAWRNTHVAVDPHLPDAAHSVVAKLAGSMSDG